MIARVCHAANTVLSQINGEGDKDTWEEMSQETKDGVIEEIKRIMQDPNLTGRDIHDGWMATRLADGWVHGDEINTELKTHPNLVEYDELSEIDRKKDDLFLGIVRSLM